MDAGDSAIGCDKCEHWAHSTEMCSGLPQRVIDAISEYDGRGINFVCTKCRLKQECSSSKPNQAQPLMMELITQIFQQMKGLCNTVQSLMEQVKTVSSKPPPAPTPSTVTTPPPAKPSQDEYRVAIRREVQEMNEREKRRSSIIVKGLSANSSREIAQKFSQITQDIMGFPTSLSDITQIQRHSGMFRAKILDDEVRKRVLEKSKSLRGTDYGGVYISRDLTFAQRGELYARRQARRAEASQCDTMPTTQSVILMNEQAQSVHPASQGNSLPL